jgi:multiple sugar transport system substrate-binding protein
MKLSKAHVLRGAIGAALIAAAIGGYSRRREERTLEVAVCEEIGWPIRLALDQFVAERRRHHRGIEFNVHVLSYDKLNQALTQAVHEKPQFDVVTVDHPWIPSLGPDLQSLPIRDPGTLPPAVLRAVCNSCDAYGTPHAAGVPYVGNFEMFAINKRILPGMHWPEKWPKNWEEVVDIAGQLRRDSKSIPYGIRASTDDSSVTDEFMPVYWGQRRDVAKAVRTISALAEFNPSIFPVLGSGEISSLILHGDVAMGVVWSDWAMQMGDADPDLVHRDVEFGPVPGGAPELGIWLLSIPNNAPHRRLASEFVEFAGSQDQLRAAGLVGNPPIREELLDDPGLKLRYGYLLAAQRESMRTTRARPSCKQWNEIEKEIAQALRERYYRNVTDDETAAKITRAFEACPEAEGDHEEP